MLTFALQIRQQRQPVLDTLHIVAVPQRVCFLQRLTVLAGDWSDGLATHAVSLTAVTTEQ